mgnify:CR=1 FL=1
MKFGVCLGGVSRESIELASDSGADFIVANLYAISEYEPEKLREIIDISRSYGQKITATNGFFGKMPFFESPENYEKSADYVKRTFEKMAYTDIKFMTLGSGVHRHIPDGMAKEAAEEKYIKLCREVIAPEAANYGYTIGIEHLNKKEVNYINTALEAYELVRKIDRPQIKMLVDYYHFMLENEVFEEFEKFGSCVAHMHIASALNDRHLPLPVDGEAESYRKFFKAVKRYVDSDVDMAIEGGIPEPKVQNLRHSFHYLRKLRSES